MVPGAALAAAPPAPGVYFFLGAGRELLYVGKAGDLRSRLAQHGRGGGRLADMYAAAVDVRWEVHGSEHEAVCREADVLVACPPPWNAAGAWGGWTDVVVGGRSYGCFPHLGPGLASVPGTRCTDGWAALRRLLDAAGDADLGRPVHDLMTGTSARALDLLLAAASERSEPYQRPALRRDRQVAEGFVEHGPAALRALRRRHGLGTGHVSRERFVAAITAELHDLLGPDLVLVTPPDASLLGRRRARSPRHTTR